MALLFAQLRDWSLQTIKGSALITPRTEFNVSRTSCTEVRAQLNSAFFSSWQFILHMARVLCRLGACYLQPIDCAKLIPPSLCRLPRPRSRPAGVVAFSHQPSCSDFRYHIVARAGTHIASRDPTELPFHCRRTSAERSTERNDVQTSLPPKSPIITEKKHHYRHVNPIQSTFSRTVSHTRSRSTQWRQTAVPQDGRRSRASKGFPRNIEAG